MIIINNISTNSLSFSTYWVYTKCWSDKDCCLVYNANPCHTYYYPYFRNQKIDVEMSKDTNVTWPICEQTVIWSWVYLTAKVCSSYYTKLAIAFLVLSWPSSTIKWAWSINSSGNLTKTTIYKRKIQYIRPC